MSARISWLVVALLACKTEARPPPAAKGPAPRAIAASSAAPTPAPRAAAKPIEDPSGTAAGEAARPATDEVARLAADEAARQVQESDLASELSDDPELLADWRTVLEHAAPEAPLELAVLSQTPLPDKMNRRIRFRLRSLSKAPVALRTIAYVPRSDGSAKVVATYETSVYEECVRDHPNRKDGSKACLKKRLVRGCVRSGVVWAHFAVPKAGTPPEQGGELTVYTRPLEREICTIEKEVVRLADLDGDGRLELELNVLSAHTPEADNRGQWNHEYWWSYYLLRGDLAPERSLSLEVAKWYVDNSQDGYSPDPLTLFEARDVDHDGHRDLVIYDPLDLESCNPDEQPRDAPEEGKPNPCALVNRATALYLYNAPADAWRRATADQIREIAAAARARR